MKVLLATITDLYTFASQGLKEPSASSGSVTYDQFAAAEEQLAASAALAQPIDADAVLPSGITKNTVMYVASLDVPLYRNPTKEFDGLLQKLNYGTMVMVLGQVGRWAEVSVAERSGWVLYEDLVTESVNVYPDFTIGEPNLSDDPNTIRLRAAIDDEFGGAEIETVLTAPEYVTYKLKKRAKYLPWPQERPRLPGQWHKLLKGGRGVSIGIKPRTDSVMEFTLEDGQGHVAYVEKVATDETITISEANWPHEGIYNERVLTFEEWRELTPVFISVA